MIKKEFCEKFNAKICFERARDGRIDMTKEEVFIAFFSGLLHFDFETKKDIIFGNKIYVSGKIIDDYFTLNNAHKFAYLRE